MPRGEPPGIGADYFVRLCKWLEWIGRWIGVSASIQKASASRSIQTFRLRPILHKTRAEIGPERDRLEELRLNLVLGEVHLGPDVVLAAGKSLWLLLTVALLAAGAILFVLEGTRYVAPCAMTALLVPILGKNALTAYPSRRAAKRAARLLRSSSETANLMIMSLRHEPSISRAIAFASKRDGEFPSELKACTWGVIMGRFASFEEAMIGLGQKWSRYSSDLKASLNAMVTASRESTEDGKRRALDRANNALISGAKRRIEEYALSLTTPSMMIFGLGILLPLMVGSFLPMLSWNLWSTENLKQVPGTAGQGQTTIEIVFIMNILFPSVAALVAMNALSGHPLDVEGRGPARTTISTRYGLAAVAAASTSGIAIGVTCLSGMGRSALLLLSSVTPIALWLLIGGRGTGDKIDNGIDVLEHALFKTGARMLEGENFEASLNGACNELGGRDAELVRKLSLRTTIMGLDDRASGHSPTVFGFSNALEGLRITRLAAAKDELTAGLLAMDLAAYLKELRDLETTLKNKLRPTVSMMKTTSLFLAPIVLGVTYAIYLSLASMIGGGGAGVGAEQFFLVLGLFLAEMNVIVVYFVWGIEGQRRIGGLMSSLGLCTLVSEAVFVATAFSASG